MKYQQITSGERYTISTFKRQGLTVIEIAYELVRHRSTIHRELKRNTCNDGRYGVLKPVRKYLGADHDHIVTRNSVKIILKLLINIYG